MSYKILQRIKALINPLNSVSCVRSIYYSLRFSNSRVFLCGKKVRIITGKNSVTSINENSNIGIRPNSIGYISHPKYEYTFIQNNGFFKSSSDFRLKAGARLLVGEGASLKIGSNVLVESNTIIIAKSSIIVGNDTWISWNCNILDSDFHHLVIDNEEKTNTLPIVIGNNCWIGTGVTILKGSIIGDNVVIGANSTVTGTIPSNSLAVGSPCKVIRKNIQWIK